MDFFKYLPTSYFYSSYQFLQNSFDKHYSDTPIKFENLASLFKIHALNEFKSKAQFFAVGTTICAGMLSGYSSLKEENRWAEVGMISVFFASWMAACLLSIEFIETVINWQKFKRIVHKSGENSAEKKVALLVWAKKDPNQALSILSNNDLKIIQNLSKRYKLISREVSNLKEIANAMCQISQTDKKIKLLWINAHGSQNSITLSENEKIVERPLPFECMTENGVILLDACEMGKEKVNELNFAESLKYYARKIRVIASKEDVSQNSLHLTDAKKLDFTFQNSKGEDCTFNPSHNESIQKLICEMYATPLPKKVSFAMH